MAAALRWLLNFLLLDRELFAIVAVFFAESRTLFSAFCSSVRPSVCRFVRCLFSSMNYLVDNCRKEKLR